MTLQRPSIRLLKLNFFRKQIKSWEISLKTEFCTKKVLFYIFFKTDVRLYKKILKDLLPFIIIREHNLKDMKTLTIRGIILVQIKNTFYRNFILI